MFFLPHKFCLNYKLKCECLENSIQLLVFVQLDGAVKELPSGKQ